MTVLRPSAAAHVAEASNHLVFQSLVSAAVHGPDISVTRVHIDGRHRRLRTDRSTRVYTVLDGALRMTVSGEAPESVGAGELVVVPRGTPYELAGTATYLVINAPAFMDGDDVYLEDAHLDEGSDEG